MAVVFFLAGVLGASDLSFLAKRLDSIFSLRPLPYLALVMTPQEDKRRMTVKDRRSFNSSFISLENEGSCKF